MARPCRKASKKQVTSLATAFAYRHSARLRQMFNLSEGLAEPEQWLGDAGILITHEVIKAYDQARTTHSITDWDDFAEVL